MKDGLNFVAMLVATIAAISVFGCGGISQHLPKERDAVIEQDKHEYDVKRDTPSPGTSSARMNGSHNADYGNCEPEKSWWEKLRTDPIATFTGLLVLVTGGLIVTGVRQETMSRKHERAYVFAVPAPSGRTVGDEDGFVVGAEFRLHAENTGRTPAVIKGVQWQMRMLRELADTPQWDADTATYQILHPDQAKTPTKAPPAYYRSDWAEPHVIYGHVIYEDVFRQTHTSGFLYLIERQEGTVNFQHFAIGDERFSKYYEWN